MTEPRAPEEVTWTDDEGRYRCTSESYRQEYSRSNHTSSSRKGDRMTIPDESLERLADLLATIYQDLEEARRIVKQLEEEPVQ